MKALILAAGYATRLYPLTLDRAKPLLPVAGKPTIEHIIERICQIKEIDRIFVVTNQKFFKQFQDWQEKFSSAKPIRIINDNTACEEDRLGAIGDIEFVLNKENISDDLLVVAGDNLFESGLPEFIDFARGKAPASSIGLYKLKDQQAVKKYSQVELDQHGQVVDFIEKPKQPTSTLVAKCIYFFPQTKLRRFSEYIALGASTDQPGNYISWLAKNDLVFGFVFRGKWYDIGCHDVYTKANKDFNV